MWGASIWHRDDVYAIKNNLNERIWRNGQILKFLNPWTFPATESSIMGLPKYICNKARDTLETQGAPKTSKES